MKYTIITHGGAEIQVEEQKGKEIQRYLQSGEVGFITINGESINSKSIVGVFDETTMFDREQRKRGSWKCNFNNYHGKFDVCDCGRYTSIDTEQKLLDSAKPHYEWKTALKEVLKGYMQVKGITKLEDLDEFGLKLVKCKSFNELKKKVYEVQTSR